jgi:oligopeptide/dipeptide ABC transporter ATP-binding protein
MKNPFEAPLIDPANGTPLIEVVDLKKYFKVRGGILHAVDGVSLEIHKGKTLGVVGESGCGKSTLGRSILRLVEPTSGDVKYRGKSIIDCNKNQMREMRKKMQIIFQDPYSSINPRMSVIEIIAEFMIVNKTHGSKKECLNQAVMLMDTVGLARRCANVYPHELDGGRRQRIGVARALSLQPEFIVCDEPVSALDVSIQAQILNLLMDIQEKNGLAYIFITHDLSVVKHISDEVLVMYLGKCVEKARKEDLFDRPLHPYTRALLAAIPIPDISMRSKEIEIIRGEVTNPINPEPICRFANRCNQCQPICTQEEPAFREVATGHFVACHFA